MGLNHEINRGKKSCDTLPLRHMLTGEVAAVLTGHQQGCGITGLIQVISVLSNL